MEAAEAAIGCFRERAREFCRHLERHASVRRGLFLRQLAERLAALYIAGLNLPDVEPDSDDLLPDAVTPEQRGRLRDALSATLGSYQGYRSVFDPFGKDDTDPVAGSLVDDLEEIYCDVRKVLASDDGAARIGRPNDRLWEARFDFVHHWSRHATSALKAVDALLNLHHVEALDPAEPDV